LTNDPSRSTVEPRNGGYLGDVGLQRRDHPQGQGGGRAPAASLLAHRAAGASREELDRAAADLRALLRVEDRGEGDPTWPELAMFRPVRTVRSRQECVLLPFDGLGEALGEASR
jgi:NifU-like protein involved in Fe-S cluster formation